MMQKFVLFIFYLLLFEKGISQDPVFHSINTLNGFSSNNIYDILQDKTGFIWIAHDKGLSRYDGFQFLNLKSPALQGSSLSNLIEFDQRIWCQDFAGNIYAAAGNQLLRDNRFPSLGTFIPAGTVKGKLVSVANDSIRTIDEKTGIYKSTFSGARNLSTVGYKQKGVDYLSNRSLFSFQEGSVAIQELTNEIFLFFLLETQEGIFGIDKSKYPYLYKLENKSWNPMPILERGFFIQSIQLIEQEIWIGTTNGAFCFDLFWKPKYNGQCFFKNTSISKIIKDRESNYWFGTINKGLYVVPDIQIKVFPYDGEGISALAVYKGNILAGTLNNSLITFNKETYQFSKIHKEPTNHEILTIYSDEKDHIIYCSDRLVQLKGGIKTNEILMAGKSITSINNDLFAVAYSIGICLIGKSSEKQPVPFWLQQKESMHWVDRKFNLMNYITRGRCVAYNPRDSVLYAATTNGLFFFSPTGTGKILYNKQDIFPSQMVTYGDRIYFSTYNQGVFYLSGEQQVFKIAPPNIIASASKIALADSALWLLGTDVLQQYHLGTKKIFSYTYSNGLPAAELKDFLIFEQKIFLATSEGLVVRTLNGPIESLSKPVLTINQVWVNDRPVEYKRNLLLKPSEKNIDIDFSVLAFKAANSSNLSVRYRLNRDPWKSISKVRRISLPALSAGSYTLELQVISENGAYASVSKALQFSIVLPFYKSYWFNGFVLLILIGIIYAFSRRRINKIKAMGLLQQQKMQLENALQKSMLSAIKSQMNPHFIFNALNTIQSYIYANDKEQASEYLGKFSELTRLILEVSNRETISLDEEIKTIGLYLELEKLRFDEKLNYTIRVSEKISPETSFIPPMLIQPYIENAIKHGLLHKKEDWRLTVDFHKKDQGVEVVIEDNGIGRIKSAERNKLKNKQHNGFSTVANEKRLDILNKGLPKLIYFEVIDKTNGFGQSEGTKVRLFIPFMKQELWV